MSSQVSAFLDNPGNKLNYHAYGEQLFEILIAGGLLGECLFSKIFRSLTIID
jgi:hypothetical protein